VHCGGSPRTQGREGRERQTDTESRVSVTDDSGPQTDRQTVRAVSEREREREAQRGKLVEGWMETARRHRDPGRLSNALHMHVMMCWIDCVGVSDAIYGVWLFSPLLT